MALTDAFKLSIDVQLGAIELVTPVLVKVQIKLYEPDMGRKKPVKGIIEPLFGITKATEGTNKPYKIWESLL